MQKPKRTLIRNVYWHGLSPVNRIILGRAMPFENSQIKIKGFGGKEVNAVLERKTGDVGFVDYRYEGYVNGSNPSKLTVLSIGIEPEHRGNGHFSSTMNLMERLARISGCSQIKIDTILNEAVLAWATKNRYQRHTGSRNAFKVLKHSYH